MPAPRIVIQPVRPHAGQPDSAADETLDVERDRRLGERVVAGSEAGLRVCPEHRMGELVEQAVQVGHRRALVDHQPLDLEELEAVAGVDRLVAEAATGQDGADRRARLAHDPDLAGRGVRAQHPAAVGAVDVDRVPQVARRMVLGMLSSWKLSSSVSTSGLS